MAPSGPADKRTLIRRASFDLTGLPPTAEEVEAFLADESPDAFARVVDRLLASPRYGERWGRHWLDVARYADTKGYVFQEDRRYPYAYTYRDYVIRSFNEDKPYDRFILEQVAADRLPTADDPRTLAALGFLTVGRRFLNNQDDILDDRIDVVTRGLLGLTVACARCHDHKYDPIPTDDYYSLHGVFASSPEPAELPLIPGDTPSPEAADYDRQRQRAPGEGGRVPGGQARRGHRRLPRPRRRLPAGGLRPGLRPAGTPSSTRGPGPTSSARPASAVPSRSGRTTWRRPRGRPTPSSPPGTPSPRCRRPTSPRRPRRCGMAQPSVRRLGGRGAGRRRPRARCETSPRGMPPCSTAPARPGPCARPSRWA